MRATEAKRMPDGKTAHRVVHHYPERVEAAQGRAREGASRGRIPKAATVRERMERKLQTHLGQAIVSPDHLRAFRPDVRT